MIALPVTLVPSILAAVLSPSRYTYIYIEVTSHTNFFSFHLFPQRLLIFFSAAEINSKWRVAMFKGRSGYSRGDSAEN